MEHTTNSTNFERLAEETEVQYFIRIARCYCCSPSYPFEEVGEEANGDDIEVDGGFRESTDDLTDGTIVADCGDLEGNSAALDAIPPLGAAPEWCMGKVPLPYHQHKRNRKTKTVFPFKDDLKQKLVNAEEKVIKGIPGYMNTFETETSDVEVSPGVTVHTVHFWSKSQPKSQTTKPPLVLLHGTGGGIPCFHKIYEELAQIREIYAIDVPGFGLTSRINFALETENCENQFEDILEAWRNKMGLDKMVLLGHSFGAYVCTIYAINYHRYVSNLILLDPWGVLSEKEAGKSCQGVLYEAARTFCAKFKVNPAKSLQHLGPVIGGILMNFYLSENIKKCYGPQCMEYLQIANTAGEMSGMKALLILSDFKIEYPVRPLKKRLINRMGDVKLPLTFIYGKESPYRNDGGDDIKFKAGEAGSLVNVEYVDGSDHHIHAEKPQKLIEILTDLLGK